ncbi:MAG TPA: TolC family protein, partial [Gemmataceae bacterium]|nr:TolC family protein [Gemmataceae bacterium]
MRRLLSLPQVAVVLIGMVPVAGARLLGAPPPGELPKPRPASNVPDPPPLSPSILDETVKPIDLGSALRLAGVQNPEILQARERVTEAVALRQLAAAQLLPTINAGTNVDVHQGVLQQSNGNILKVNRDSLYLGLGANAVGAGTVNIPGIVLVGNAAEIIYGGLVARQVVRQREFESVAVGNTVLLRVASGYLDLLQAEGRRALAIQTRNESREVARITADFARIQQGRKADADRAATDLDQRNADVLEAENAVLLASARLAELLGLDPSIRLHAIDGWVVPAPIVPDPVPLPELLAIALTQRPELAARQAAIQAALLRLREAKLLPFSPNLILGFSAGTFGGGSNLVSNGLPQANGTLLQQPRFDSFDARQDVDATVFWSLRNLGLGNLALARAARSETRITNFEFLEVLNRVRAEVATAYAR